GPARQRVLRNACAERLSAADRVRASGGRGRAPTRAQPGSRGPATGGAAEKAGCEEKETRRGSGPPGGTAPHGLGSACARIDLCAAPCTSPCTCPCACACTGPSAFPSDRGGAVGDQLSLAVAIIRPPP